MSGQTSTKIRLCASADIAPDSPTRIEVAGLSVALVRLGDEFFAIGDTCSHANFSLSDGEVDPEEKTLECPKHGAAFLLDSGEPTCLPATKPVPVYTVAVEEGEVYIWLEADSVEENK